MTDDGAISMIAVALALSSPAVLGVASAQECSSGTDMAGSSCTEERDPDSTSVFETSGEPPSGSAVEVDVANGDADGAAAAAQTGADTPKNWALGAGIFGIVWSTALLPAAVAADAIRIMVKCDCLAPVHGYLEPRLVVPVSAAMIPGTPLIAAGAASARRSLKTSGCKACRILGWIAYGLSLPLAATWAGFAIYHGDLHPSGFDAPHGPMAAAGALAAASCVLMASDAFVSWKKRTADKAGSLEGRAFGKAAFVPMLGLHGGSIFLGLSGAW